MIPTAEERQIRQCNLCIGFDTDRGDCQHDFDIADIRRNYVRERSSVPQFYENLRKYMDDAAKEYPCKYHITPDELKELIDSQ